MKPAKKKAIRFAVACVAAGLLIGFIALAALDFNFFEMGTMAPVTNEYALAEAFTNIEVYGGSSDVRLLPSEDGACTVLCHETDRVTHTVTVEKGTLTIRRNDNRKWFEHIGFTWSYWGPMEVVISLPERAYEELYIRTPTGDVEVPGDFSFTRAEVDGSSGNIRFEAEVSGDLSVKSVSGNIRVSGVSPANLTARSTSGDIAVEAARVRGTFSCHTVSGSQKISDVTCRSASVYATSGDVLAADLLASEDIRMENISGRLELIRCDADTLWLKNVSGDVIGSLRTAKTFAANTTSGRIRVPADDAAGGGTCEVKTVSGDIALDVLEQ